MWNDTESLTIRRRRFVPAHAPGLLLGLSLGLLLTVPVVAQDAAPEETPSAATSSAATSQTAGSELVARVTAAYEVLPVQGGVLLRPRREYRGVRAIEIADGSVAINGEAVPEEAARGWLGSRADDVLELADMSSEELRSLFDLGEPRAAAVSVSTEGSATSSAEGSVAGSASSAAAGKGRAEANGVGSAAVEPLPVPPRAIEPPPEPRSRRGSQTGFGSNVYVASDEVVDDVVVLGGSVKIDGRVDGDAVVVGGRLEINGEVDQNAAVIGGSMVLGPHADIGGDASVVGGSLQRATGAHVGGKVEQVEKGWHLAPFSAHGDVDWTPPWRSRWYGWSPWNEVGDFFSLLIVLVLLGLLIAIVLTMGRNPIERMSARIANEPLKAGVVGLLVALLFFPVFLVVSVLLCISIIGIPIFVILLLGFIFLGIPGLLVIALIGFSAVCLRIGTWLGRRFGWNVENPFMAAMVGLVGTFSLLALSQILDVFGGPVDFFAAMFCVAGLAVLVIAWCVGFGAVFLHLWSGRSGGSRRGAGAPLPPVPQPPQPQQAPRAPQAAPAAGFTAEPYSEPYFEPEAGSEAAPDGEAAPGATDGAEGESPAEPEPDAIDPPTDDEPDEKG